MCLQPILRDKVRALAQTVEMELTPKAGTSLEYRHYVRERDKAAEKIRIIDGKGRQARKAGPPAFFPPKKR